MSEAQPRINISRDRLSAELFLPATCAIDIDGLRRLVGRAGLRHGLLATAIAEAATSDSEADRHYTLARGTPPRDPCEAGPQFTVTEAQ